MCPTGNESVHNSPPIGQIGCFPSSNCPDVIGDRRRTSSGGIALSAGPSSAREARRISDTRLRRIRRRRRQSECGKQQRSRPRLRWCRRRSYTSGCDRHGRSQPHRRTQTGLRPHLIVLPVTSVLAESIGLLHSIGRPQNTNPYRPRVTTRRPCGTLEAFGSMQTSVRRSTTQEVGSDVKRGSRCSKRLLALRNQTTTMKRNSTTSSGSCGVRLGRHHWDSLPSPISISRGRRWSGPRFERGWRDEADEHGGCVETHAASDASTSVID